MANSISKICDFIHHAQKERGLSILYTRNNEGRFSEELHSQFAVVDEYIKLLVDLPTNQSSHFNYILKGLQDLPIKRANILAKKLTPNNVLLFYTRKIITPAIETVQELAVTNSLNNPQKVSAFINFLHWKERVGLERAIGTQLLDLDWSNIPNLKTRLEFIVSEQQAYERMFITLADDNGKKAIEELKKNNDVFIKIDRISQNFSKEIPSNEVQSITSYEWFILFTAKMDMLYEVEKTIFSNLTENYSSQNKTTAVIPNLENSYNRLQIHENIIKTLPLFVGLDKTSLASILKHANLVTFNKGSTIFMQGQPASSFYIILDGWVKLFKCNIDGQESILQMMTTGDSLLDIVILNNSSFPASALAVSGVKLLSLPTTILREKLQNDKDLAINMLALVARRSQSLISQFEQLTLKTVTQRVGWFLLKLFLENGATTNNLKLPYDKSLIAGLLGMKPETFSRTLQTLKEQGINIDRDTINILDVFTLCDYCDMDLAAECKRAGTSECPYPECLN